MANTLGSLVVNLGLDAAQFTSGLTKAEYEAQKSLRNIARGLDDLRRAADTVLGAVGLGLSVHALVEGLNAISEAAQADERSFNQLNAVLRSTQSAVGLTTTQLSKMADELHRSTIFDDTSIRSAEVALLRFRDVQGETFKEALQLAPDVAAVLGVSLPQAAELLGRSLSGVNRDMRQLREAGLFLSQQQIDMIARMKESGDVAGANKILLDELRKSIGGSGESDTTGLYGATKKATRAWEEFKSSLGERFLGTDFMTNLTSLLDKWTTFVKTGSPDVGATAPKGTREASGKIGGLPFPENQQAMADEGKARQQAEQAASEAYLREQERLKARAANAASFYGQQLALQKAFLEQRSLQETFAYQRGQLTTEQFYDSERKRAVETFEAVATSLGKQAEAADAWAKSEHATVAEVQAERDKISTLDRQMTAERENMNNALLKIDQAQILSNERLGDSYDEVREKVMLMNGETAKAAASAFDRQNRDLTRGVGTPADVQAGNTALREQLKVVADLDRAKQQYSTTLNIVSTKQAQIDLLAQTGGASELEVFARRAELARQYIPILQMQIEAQQKLAEAQTDPVKRAQSLADILRMRLEVEQLAASTDALARKFNDAFGGAFADQLTAVADGTKSVKQGIIDLGRAWVHVINEIAAKELASALFGKGGGASGFGSLLASLFGGTGGSQFTEGSANFVGPIAGAAGGTSYAPGGLMKVGEYGTELVSLPRGSQVIPHDRLLAARQARGGGDINVSVSMPAGVSKQTAAQLGAEVARGLAYAGRNT